MLRLEGFRAVLGQSWFVHMCKCVSAHVHLCRGPVSNVCSVQRPVTSAWTLGVEWAAARLPRPAATYVCWCNREPSRCRQGRSRLSHIADIAFLERELWAGRVVYLLNWQEPLASSDMVFDPGCWEPGENDQPCKRPSLVGAFQPGCRPPPSHAELLTAVRIWRGPQVQALFSP